MIFHNFAFDAPVMGVSVGVLPSRLVRKTRMVGLPDGQRCLTICLAVLTEYLDLLYLVLVLELYLSTNFKYLYLYL